MSTFEPSTPADAQQPPTPTPEQAGATKACPRCAEQINPDAKVCRFCGANLRPLLSRPSTWAMAAAALVLVAGAVTGAVVYHQHNSDAAKVSSALECDKLSPDKDGNGSLSPLGSCAARRLGSEMYRGMMNQPPKYGMTVDNMDEVMDCTTKGGPGDDDPVAKCLLATGIFDK